MDGGGITVEYQTLDLGSNPQYVHEHAMGTPAPAPVMSSLKLATLAHAASPPPQPEFVSPPSNAKDYLDADTGDIEPRYHTITNILGVGSPPGLIALHVAAVLHLQIEDESGTFSKAERHQPWRRAML
jgi:hypothetical protein